MTDPRFAYVMDPSAFRAFRDDELVTYVELAEQITLYLASTAPDQRSHWTDEMRSHAATCWTIRLTEARRELDARRRAA